ncbi:tetratricopeptide repeat protein [Salegentibacter flavus]|uniref:Tetratricopeptide repeat-containing protein n=1 Tax=Salegentibacter flavus TaxID=287099 RepID=A0A1I5AXA4_9FLAO|nr:tetratricopeptide repeat protein [Salegentibacter flavus]SFN67075.1 Tetratricopeptide repeat-containing protein [Salegentibacter flavus]
MNIIKPVLLLLIIFFGSQAEAQENNRKDQREAEMYLEEAEDALSENDFASAEAAYRKAIAKDPDNPTAKYNLGNLYYNKEKPSEAGERLNQAGEIADSKETKHKAFHNLGNSFMRQKKYKEAVEAYKDALRNNPRDEETRYNLALAKKMLEEEQQQQDDQDDGEGGDNQDQEQQEDQEDQGGDGENEQESDDEGEQEEKEDEGDQQEDENEGEGDQEQEQDEGGDQQEQPQPQPQPQQGQLSPEQIKSLLEAMNNEERKVQDKINAEKAKGAKVKTDKDW